jgi:hypothetical protein
LQADADAGGGGWDNNDDDWGKDDSDDGGWGDGDDWGGIPPASDEETDVFVPPNKPATTPLRPAASMHVTTFFFAPCILLPSLAS